MKLFSLFIILLVLLAADWSFAQESVTEVPQRASLVNIARGQAQARQIDKDTLSILGRVITDMGSPVRNAKIFVRPVGSSWNANRKTTTDESGNFRLGDFVPGRYIFEVSAKGYVRVGTSADSDRPAYCRPGDFVTIKLMKGGVITGTVMDAQGQPLVAARVQAVRVRDSERRLTREAAVGREWQTDDRGVYRIYGLPPGSYLVVARGGSSFYYGATVSSDDVLTYFPRSTRDTAVEVIVNSGDEITEVDIRCRDERGHTVSGTISGMLMSDPTVGATITLLRRPSGTTEDSIYLPSYKATRSFEIHGVSDGEHYLVAYTIGNVSTTAVAPPVRVMVSGADVSGVDLRLALLGSISGRLVSDVVDTGKKKSACKDNGPVRWEETLVNARNDERNDNKRIGLDLFSEATRSPSGQGLFTLTNIYAGHYRVEAELPSENLYITSIAMPTGVQHRGSRDVALNGLAVGPGESVSNLIVSVAEGAAALHGKVVPREEGIRVPTGVHVVMVPADPHFSNDLTRFNESAVQSDYTFTFKNIAPGRYYLVVEEPPENELTSVTFSRPWWNVEQRSRLLRAGMKENKVLELERCQRINDYLLRYAPIKARTTSIASDPDSPRKYPK